MELSPSVDADVVAGRLRLLAWTQGDNRLSYLAILRAFDRAHRRADRPQCQRRGLWDANGVVVDPLSSQVLVLGLGESADGEPRRWTLRQLQYTAPPNAEALWVCENPAVVAVAADRLGELCPPLLCTEGQPSTAARLVVDAAAEVHWHNDYDWPGVRMTAAAITRHAAVPWRMSASDYEEAVAMTDPVLQRALEGRVTATPWDPDLAATMTRYAVAVEEELVVEGLLADLT